MIDSRSHDVNVKIRPGISAQRCFAQMATAQPAAKILLLSNWKSIKWKTPLAKDDPIVLLAFYRNSSNIGTIEGPKIEFAVAV
jgi:hypothetical protein